MKVAVFRDPLKETLSYKLSDFFEPEVIAEDTEFELWRLGSPRVTAYIGARARAEPDSLWGRWYRGKLEEVECHCGGKCSTCKGHFVPGTDAYFAEGGCVCTDADKKGEGRCAMCGGSGKITEILQMRREDLAAITAAVTKRANPLRVDVSENGAGPEIDLWDTAKHEDERQELLEGFFVGMPELAMMLFVRAFEAEGAYAKAYRATVKNSKTSSRRKPARRKRKPSAASEKASEPQT